MVYYDHHDTSGRMQLPWKVSKEECAYMDAILDLVVLGRKWKRQRDNRRRN